MTLFGILHPVHHLRHSSHNHKPEIQLANGILGISVLLVGGVSLGGFVTMTVLAIAIIGGKKRLVALVEGSRVSKVLSFIEYASSFLTILACAFLFVGALLDRVLLVHPFLYQLKDDTQ